MPVVRKNLVGWLILAVLCCALACAVPAFAWADDVEDSSSFTAFAHDEGATSRDDEDVQAQTVIETQAVTEAQTQATTAATTYVNMYRLYNPNSGEHFYTSSLDEATSIVGAGWSPEGIGWYASNVATQTIAGRWIVTAAWGTLERYWLDSTATIATSRLIDPDADLDSGAGYHAYATSTGAVLRGKLRYGAGMLLADNDGALAWTEGWLVTGIYDGGTLQRYRIDSSPGDGLMGAHLGEFDLDGSRYFGTYDQGYVARNTCYVSGSTWYACNNDGVASRIGKIELDVPYLNQYDEGAEMGCEGISLYMALRYKGLLSDVSYRSFQASVPMSPDGNPYNGFVGSPWKYTGNIDGELPAALAAWGSQYTTCTDITGCSREDLVYQLACNRPVVVWTNGNFSTAGLYLASHWYGTTPSTWHVMVLTGYDPSTGSYKVNDPASSKRQYWVSASTFESVWNVYRGAVAVG